VDVVAAGRSEGEALDELEDIARKRARR